MSRFYNYINEESSSPKEFSEFLDKLIKDCPNYIKELRNIGVNLGQPPVLYRGMKNPHFFGKKKVRKNRRPLNTKRVLHEYLDIVFEKKFGERLRSEGLFTTPSLSTAARYGSTYLIFPVGKYSIYWSEKIADLFIFLNTSEITQKGMDFPTTEFDNRGNNDMIPPSWFTQSICNGERNQECKDKWKELYWKNMKIVADFYQKGNLKKALTHNNEVIIMCDEYYFIDHKIFFDPEINKIFMEKIFK